MRNKTWTKAVYVCTILILLILMIYGGLRVLESAVFSKAEQEFVATKSVVRDGVKYYPRKDVSVIMLLGVDKEGKVVPSDEPNHGYAVDMITLLVFDQRSKELNLVCINRDTMAEMPRLDEKGREVGTRIAQLALSHTYGRGVEDSCVNTRKTVSKLLRGITIDYYLAMNMDAVAILNDAVGGVEVTVKDDFSRIDPTIGMGKVVLKGDQALSYVQERMTVGDQLNLSRIERQKEYMRNFVTAMRNQAEQSSTFLLHAYDQVSDYIVTDMTSAVVSRLMEDYSDYTLAGVYSLEGENVLGEEHYEYYVDEDALEEMVLKLFFERKK